MDLIVVYDHDPDASTASNGGMSKYVLSIMASLFSTTGICMLSMFQSGSRAACALHRMHCKAVA
jgi:hypothetical protein